MSQLPPSTSFTPGATPEPEHPLRAGPLHEELTDADRDRIAAELNAAEELLRTTPPPDPWAHRRGEPRVFAFFWTLYVLLAVAGSVSWVARFAPVTAGSYAPAARIMLLVVAVGATVLWPMTRLCQASPGRGAAANALADVLVVLIPLQMIIWPLIFLAQWPARTVAALAALCAVWVALVGAVLALALGERSQSPRDPALLARSLWMMLILLLVLGAPFVLMIIGKNAPVWLPMLSPLSAVSDVTGQGMSGPQRPVSELQWRMILATGALAGALWMLSGARGERRDGAA